jgi:hypothetical protein
MTTETTTPAAALAAKPPGYTVKTEVTITCAYTLELSKAAAKAICADWIDPNEKWDDQDESVIETAMESLLEGDLSAVLSEVLPMVIATKVEGKQVKLTLAADSVSVDLETPEVA